MTITRYRKLPTEVDTIQWTGSNEAAVQAFTGGPGFFHALDDTNRESSDDPQATARVFDKLHSTWVLVYTGQHIVRGVKGEYYPIAEDVLAETYEPAPSAPPEPLPGKPPLPAGPFADWERIAVDERDGSDFAEILRLGSFAADNWTFSPAGPYQRSQTAAEATRSQLREALLHLLELGLIDIDTDRLRAADGYPMQRSTQP
ncbi:hypothetical protein SEA_KROMP_59 [Streptomyces phage Kromp]|uniref:Uncharacterized protein n=1 Tax=Streptomyces phage Kromp TaxID=2315619 RepID=A0A386KBQ9_9CAUD|nr:hypothetical protein SEA_KROMP_59 [Streptomyces phage Kromp]